MRLDLATVASYSVDVLPKLYLRTTPIAFRSTPLGMGFGDTRFASPSKSFKLLYIAEDLATSITEAIIRDRFEGTAKRELMRSEVADWGICEVDATTRLRVLDLRGDCCFQLGISTDVTGAKGQDAARQLSQAVYDTTSLDGIVYRSRLRPNKTCVAIYDRVVSVKLSSGRVVELETLAALVPALREIRTDLIR